MSGVYSSAGSGIKMLDDARVQRPGVFTLPDRIWIARWDGVANTSTSYIRSDGWLPGDRMKQYQGGHDEVWGGVRINIDRNYLDLGRGSVARPGDPLRRDPGRASGSTSRCHSCPAWRSRPRCGRCSACCREQGLPAGRLSGGYVRPCS